MAFDITKALGDIGRRTADAGEAKRELRYIPLHMIDTNPRNFYSVEGIDELADNIRLFGLMEPLLVRKEASGRYMLISGHRRRLALMKLAEEAEDYPQSMYEPVACMVETAADPLPGIEPGGDDELRARQLAEELKLIYANADTRVMSSADTAWQVRRIRELFTGLQELGYQFPGKMRDHVAAAAKVSATRVARLDVIQKNLEPSLRKAWREGTLGETSAYEIARRPKDVQKLVAQRLDAKILGGMTTERVAQVLDACEADGNRDREAREDWNKNVGAMAEAAGNSSTFDGEAYLAERAAEDEAFAELLDYWADMFFQELDGIQSRQEGIETLKKRFRNSGYYGSMVNYDGSAKGLTLYKKSSPKKILRTWTDVYDMLCLDALFRVAQIPEVSAADTGTQWQTGNPKEVGEYVVVYGVGVEENQATRSIGFMNWDGENWVSLKNGTPIKDGKTVYRWVKLPEV